MTAGVRTNALLRVGRLAAVASGAIAAIGVVFMVAMYLAFGVGAGPAGLVAGWINDVLVMVSYLLAVPVVLAVRAVLRPQAPAVVELVTAIGLGAIAAIVILQWLLVTGRLAFEQEIGPVTAAFLVLGSWFAATAYLGRASGLLPVGVRTLIFAILYFGYPVWALWVARRLLVLTSEPGVGGVSASANP